MGGTVEILEGDKWKRADKTKYMARSEGDVVRGRSDAGACLSRGSSGVEVVRRRNGGCESWQELGGGGGRWYEVSSDERRC